MNKETIRKITLTPAEQEILINAMDIIDKIEDFTMEGDNAYILTSFEDTEFDIDDLARTGIMLRVIAKSEELIIN